MSSKIPWASLRSPPAKKPRADDAAEPAPPPGFSATLGPYTPGDPIPAAVATEENTDTAWAMWKDLTATENQKFAETMPAPAGLRMTPEERSYAPTLPAGLQPQTPEPVRRFAPGPQALSVGEVIVESRRNNRVCPLPERWQQLYALLPAGASEQPTPPLIGAGWHDSSSITKRVCLRGQIEFAGAHGCLEQVFKFLKSLPEEEWLHMGD